MENLGFENVKITSGFWKERQDINRGATQQSVWDRFKETGRVDAFKCLYKKGDGNPPHYFWDSDVAKWIEGASYNMILYGDRKDEEKIEEIIDDIEKNADENGYFNSYFLTVEPEGRFTDRNKHELYCAGHLMEAAIAYKRATGRDRFLKLMEKYADYIRRVFVQEGSAAFLTPGHEEIELALVKMYRETGKKKYLDLAAFFVDKRGSDDPKEDFGDLKENIQCHQRPVDQREAKGHAVRAAYLYCAMADLARITGDGKLKTACLALFDDIVNKKMFITGGVGSNSRGESYAYPYYLPNVNAYSETCAAIGTAMFAGRMQELEADSRYADAVERIIYNGALSGVSLDGGSFFYENPLEIIPQRAALKNMHYPITQRVKVFGCSCCPPNVLRFIASLGGLVYTLDGDRIYLQQFAESEAVIPRESGKITLRQITDYPLSGKVTLICDADADIEVRVPGWSEAYSDDKKPDGYMTVRLKKGEKKELDFEMKPVFYECDPRCGEDLGKVALARGPVVYCLEGLDNGGDLDGVFADVKSEITVTKEVLSLPILECGGVRAERSQTLYRKAQKLAGERIRLRFIPYHAFANRKETPMKVWVNRT